MNKMLLIVDPQVDFIDGVLEDRFAKQLIGLDNFDFGYKNQERGHGFFINGFFNHDNNGPEGSYSMNKLIGMISNM